MVAVEQFGRFFLSAALVGGFDVRFTAQGVGTRLRAELHQ
jgi:hypothetical protein